MLEVTQGLPYLNMGALYSPFRLRRAELKYLERGGIQVSEIGVGKLLHFVDTHSYDAVKALYTFPKLCGDLSSDTLD